MHTVEEKPVVLNPDKFVRENRSGHRRNRSDIGRVDRIRPGRSKRHPVQVHNGLARYEAADRRACSWICERCIHGEHCHCESEDCPCVCNDSDFRWSRNRLTAIGAIPVDPAKLARALSG